MRGGESAAVTQVTTEVEKVTVFRTGLEAGTHEICKYHCKRFQATKKQHSNDTYHGNSGEALPLRK